MNFPDLDDIAQCVDSDYERQFVRAEFGPGLAYYVHRLDRLMLSGNRVLDAGCGMGQWALALAQRFQHVDAVDRNRQRLAVLKALIQRLAIFNLHAYAASLEQLPCADATFDAIFCYGVIMFTDVVKVLREFHRVLRPGGRVYLCLNADGWSHYLAREKGRHDPHLRHAGLATLYTTYWQRALQQGLADALRRDTVEHNEGILPWENRPVFRIQRRLADWIRHGMSRLAGTDWKRSQARDQLCRCEAGRELLRRVRCVCGDEFLPLLLDDVLALVAHGEPPLRFGLTRAYRPEEFEPLARQAGFADFQWAVESGLVCDWAGLAGSRNGEARGVPNRARSGVANPSGGDNHARPPAEHDASLDPSGVSIPAIQAAPKRQPAPSENGRPLVPKYEGYYGEYLSVWECLMVKPGPLGVRVDLEWHYQTARQAAQTRVYGEVVPEPVLSNRSPRSFPAPLVSYARWQAEVLGGEAYLRELARRLVRGADDDEEALRRIVRFVQKAVFRDPVGQPLEEDGSMPDPLTSLLCGRGRCGHTARIVAALAHHAGLEARTRQLPRHVVAEVCCGGRWVVADADAFKGGVIPESSTGRLLTMAEIESHPYVLDRFPPTGWMIRPHSPFTRGFLGRPVHGYVDALEPDQRGFVSGHYVPAAWGWPPSVPAIREFSARAGTVRLAWQPSCVREGRLVGYRVRIGTRSRGWTYDDVFTAEAPLAATSCDVLEQETTATHMEAALPAGATRLFASVTAITDRIDKEPLTFFWPSEEACCDVQ